MVDSQNTPPANLDIHPPNIGDEIRTVRKARKMTLKALSEIAGCSIAYLSRIERGDAKISVPLLTTISKALQVDPKWFFPNRIGKGDLEKSFVVRADCRRPLSDMYTRSAKELGFEDQLLSSSLAGDCYMMISHFPVNPNIGIEKSQAQEGQTAESFAYEGEQHGIMIQGMVELTLANEVIILQSGDSFSYPTHIPHRLQNCGNEEAIMVSTMMPVRITW